MSRRQYREVNGRQQRREMMVARLRVLSKATKGSCARSNGREPCRTRSRLMQVGQKQSLFLDSRTFRVCVIGQGCNSLVLLYMACCK